MTKDQEFQLRKQAADRGYTPDKINQFIDFARQKEKVPVSQPQAQEPQGDGFFKSLVKDPLKTLVVKPATRIAQAGVAVTASTQGQNAEEERARLQAQVDSVIAQMKTAPQSQKAELRAKALALQKQMDPEQVKSGKALDLGNRAFEDQKVSLPKGGDYAIEPQRSGASGAKQIVGDAAKTASYLYTPAKGAKVLKAGSKGAVKEGFIQGAKTGAVGGAAYSGGQALIDDKSAEDVVKDTLTGAVVGGATGGAIGGVVPLVAKGAQKATQLIKDKTGLGVKSVDSTVKNKIINEVESKYDELFTGTKSAKKAFTKSTTQGKTPSRFLAEHGLIVDTEGGKVNIQSTVEKINKQAEPLEDVLDDILKTKDANPSAPKISLDELGVKAKRRISTETNKASGYLQKQYAEIDNFINELKQSFGDSVNLSTLNTIKRGQWQQSAVFDATRPSYTKDIHYALGREAKDLIETSVEEADIKGLNSYLGDHYDAIKNLQKIDGNAVKGGRLGKYFARTVGAAIGAQGGPLGSIAGAFGGDFVSGVMQNNYITNPIKKMMLERIPFDSPIYNEAQKSLRMLREGNFNRAMNTKALPAPSYMPAGPRTYESKPPQLQE